MMKLLLISLLMLSTSYARTIKVVVLDTGLREEYWKTLPMCPSGHSNQSEGKTILDRHGHGTNVSLIIDKYAKGTDYCQIIVKWTEGGEAPTAKSLAYVETLDFDVLNLSIATEEKKHPTIVEEEQTILQRLLDRGVVVISAAGNDNVELCTHPQYPAMVDERIVRVGALDGDKKLKTSNYGDCVSAWENGVFGSGSGTSYATAVHTGKMIRKLHESDRSTIDLNRNIEFNRPPREHVPNKTKTYLRVP